MVLIVSWTSRPQEGTDVKAPLMLRSWDAAMIGVIRRVGVHEIATPRETARSRSGDRCTKLMENELKDCYFEDGTADFAG